MEEPLKPVRESDRQRLAGLQIPRAYGGSHSTRFLAGRQPSVQSCPHHFAGSEFPAFHRDTVDVSTCLRPNRILGRYESDGEVLKFTSGHVVRHEPDANPWRAFGYGTSRLGSRRHHDAGSRQTVNNSLPPRTEVIVGVDENTD